MGRRLSDTGEGEVQREREREEGPLVPHTKLAAAETSESSTTISMNCLQSGEAGTKPPKQHLHEGSDTRASSSLTQEILGTVFTGKTYQGNDDFLTTPSGGVATFEKVAAVSLARSRAWNSPGRSSPLAAVASLSTQATTTIKPARGHHHSMPCPGPSSAPPHLGPLLLLLLAAQTQQQSSPTISSATLEAKRKPGIAAPPPRRRQSATAQSAPVVSPQHHWCRPHRPPRPHHHDAAASPHNTCRREGAKTYCLAAAPRCSTRSPAPEATNPEHPGRHADAPSPSGRLRSLSATPSAGRRRASSIPRVANTGRISPWPRSVPSLRAAADPDPVGPLPNQALVLLHPPPPAPSATTAAPPSRRPDTPRSTGAPGRGSASRTHDVPPLETARVAKIRRDVPPPPS